MTAEGQQPFVVGRINISRRLGTDDRSRTQADGQQAHILLIGENGRS